MVLKQQVSFSIGRIDDFVDVLAVLFPFSSIYPMSVVIQLGECGFPSNTRPWGALDIWNVGAQHPCFCELPEQDQRQAGRSRWPGGETDSKALGQHLNIYPRSWRVTAWARANTTVKIMVSKTPPHDWKQMPGRGLTHHPESRKYHCWFYFL